MIWPVSLCLWPFGSGRITPTISRSKLESLHLRGLSLADPSMKRRQCRMSLGDGSTRRFRRRAPLSVIVKGAPSLHSTRTRRNGV
ncbi:hypothetical protein C8J57DRAFT_1354420 [Mycena rebaudengoi]|nr:hypothetical protein C8J57DRAFT_1354420 [Mycena rebaudengoi]